MSAKKGIDVSEHQGKIDWEKVKPNIDFAIIRAGYGKNNIDSQFTRNVTECQRLGIPFGVYWFSYAYTTGMAKAEADYVCNAIAKYNLLYPICFDFEYDSYNYAIKNGITPNKSLLVSIAKAFLNRVEERGYYAMNYTNIDYFNKGFYELVDRYDIWLANWGVSNPAKRCGIWQYSSTGSVAGITGNVDLDYAFNDYPSIIKNMNSNTNGNNENDKYVLSSKDKNIILEKLGEDWLNKYINIATDIIAGVHGNGEERKKSISNKGFDYDIAQTIVNYILRRDNNE